MRFGEFLVHRGIVDASEILSALAEQERRRPFLPNLMVDTGCLDSVRALQLCDMADDREMSFLDVAHEQGLLTDDQVEQIEKKWRSIAPPLGMILVDLGIISESTLVEQLDEFTKQFHQRS